MAAVTLKSLHNYLKLLENASELKRRMPTTSNPRTLMDGLYETGKLVGLDEGVFKDPEHIAALIGRQRFVMIWGEPSVTDQVARIFDSSRVLLTVLINPDHFQKASVAQIGAGHQQGGAMAAHSSGWSELKDEPLAEQTPPSAENEKETPLDNLKTLLAGNTLLTCRLFRVLFEHMLGFASQSSAQQSSISLVNDLTGSREHGRSFVSTALFVLGAEIDRDHLMSFMMRQGLFGMPLFEHLLQNRDYCGAFYTFRRLERAFMESPEAEEAQLRNRLDQFNAQFGGKPYEGKVFEADGQDKVKVDAYLAATDLLEVMALTPWCMSLNTAVSMASSNTIRSVTTIARHFGFLGNSERSKDQVNQAIGEHLLAFGRQFSADGKSGQEPV
jgi:hypothetical protein